MQDKNVAEWGNVFKKGETLQTTTRNSPFRISKVATDGIYVLPRRKDQRDVFLSYRNLNALWKSRDLVADRKSKLGISKLNEAVNKVWKDAQKDDPDLNLDHTNEAQYWAMVCVREQWERDRLPLGLRDEEANGDGSDDDQRQVVMRQINERRGQPEFRNALRERHGDRCLVTACTVLEVLEAAHIKPYRGEKDNRPANGLLLRSDIHTLFDLDLLGIEPEHFRVELHPSLVDEYGGIAGKTLGFAPAHPPSQKFLRARYEKFQQKKLGAVRTIRTT
jgi:hypothetical protein